MPMWRTGQDVGMETWDAVRARRNVREYTDEPIAKEAIERILEAVRRAPSSGNWQPWNFVVVTDRDQLVELAKVWEIGGRHIAHSAATIALVAAEPRTNDTATGCSTTWAKRRRT
jgi:nitroreductase